MTEIENPPAFPVKIKRNTSSDPLATPREFQMEGMSLRDWFAGQALAGLIALDSDADPAGIAHDAYLYADMMLAARQACKAIEAAELDRQIMSWSEPKNEREWWAMHEIERLREAAKHREDAERPLLERIEKLEAENARLRAALEWIAKPTDNQFTFGGCSMPCSREARRAARQALGETQ